MPARRYVALDFYRFVAACGVVLFHFSLAGTAPWLNSYVDRFNLFVDFFFVLSGFVITITYGDRIGTWREFATFMWRRFARLYPLHIATSALLLIAAVAVQIARLPFRSVGHSPLGGLPAQLTLTQSWSLNPALVYNQPAWSISVEWALYLLFPFLMFTRRAAGIWSLAAITIGGFLLLEFLSISGAIAQPWSENFSPLRGIPTFALGCLIALVTAERKIKWGIVTGTIAFAATMLVMLLGANAYVIIAAAATGIALTALGENAADKHFLSGRTCRMLGDASYSIYMLHYFILLILIRVLWAHVFHRPIPVVGGIVILGAVCLLAVFVFRNFEKPMRDWLRISSPRQAATPNAAE